MFATATRGAGVSERSIEEVFRLLNRRGPLCESQISVELLLPLRVVQVVLGRLRAMGLVEPHPDRDERLRAVKQEVAWGLVASYARKTAQGSV
jgi:DNA-binding transcriptional ArsR family regulator